MSLRHHFSFCHADGRLESFNEAAELKQIFGDYDYVVSLVKELAAATRGEGLHFVTTWAGNRVPALERNQTILIVVGDERGQVPMGTKSARLVLRTGVKSFAILLSLKQRPLSLCVLSSIREIRNSGLRFARWLKGSQLRTPGHVEAVPIGLVGGVNLEPVAMPLRKWNLSFAGGIGQHQKLGNWRFPLCPKAAARLAMLEGIRRLSAARPHLQMRVVCTDLDPKGALPKGDYHQLLQQTQISLCPRGNFIETFRIFESARLECVVICDPLPKCWYFNNHPFIELQDWRKLPETVLELLRDQEEICRRGKLARQWWEEVASPCAVAGKMVGKLSNNVETTRPVAMTTA